MTAPRADRQHSVRSPAPTAGEVDFSDIVESTGPRNADGSLKHDGDRDEGRAA